ncbi:uncharacterized protein PgNI_05053, partial [Pyricularia grisea]|uniref:Uncharacterized protein n=1 Tax=Pyricularia grisea TaxID=148305 RepID=A0A6P8BDX3_PYRGI
MPSNSIQVKSSPSSPRSNGPKGCSGMDSCNYLGGPFRRDLRQPPRSCSLTRVLRRPVSSRPYSRRRRPVVSNRKEAGAVDGTFPRELGVTHSSNVPVLADQENTLLSGWNQGFPAFIKGDK